MAEGAEEGRTLDEIGTTLETGRPTTIPSTTSEEMAGGAEGGIRLEERRELDKTGIALKGGTIDDDATGLVMADSAEEGTWLEERRAFDVRALHGRLFLFL